MDRLRTILAIWKSTRQGITEIEEHSQLGKDYVLASGKVQFDWSDVMTVEEMPLETLEFIGFDITNIKHCVLLIFYGGKWSYAIEKFSTLENERIQYIKDKEIYDREQKNVPMRV